MSKKSDGGQAFPFVTDDDKAEHLTVEWGMSLRDWFAGMALQGLLAMCAGENVNPGTAEKAAEVAYEHADAMLNERNK